jgi:hypothetical protein
MQRAGVSRGKGGSAEFRGMGSARQRNSYRQGA